MRLCIDVDGVIASFKNGDESYKDVLPLPGSVDALKLLRDQGHYIILNTARHMKTTNSNLGQVLAWEGKNLFDWLAKFEVPYDELYFGKPFCDLYIDDNAFRFENWNNTLNFINTFQGEINN
jgi:capsule biosynthesis phosphatase